MAGMGPRADRLRREYPNHVWSYNFVEDRTHNVRKFRMLNVIDEFTPECIAIRVSRTLRAVTGARSNPLACCSIPTNFGSHPCYSAKIRHALTFNPAT